MKKAFIILALTSILFLITMNANAAECKLTVDNVTVGDAEETVDVKVILSGNPDIMGMLLTLSYDEGLTLRGIAKGTALNNLVFTEPGKFESTCKLLWDGQEPDSTNGTVVTLTFALSKTPGKYDIMLSYNPGSIYDGDFNDINTVIVNGSVTIKGENKIVYGDIRCDGVVDVSDVIYTLQILAGSGTDELSDAQKTAADVNGDGKVDVSDVIRILQHIASPNISLNPNI